MNRFSTVLILLCTLCFSTGVCASEDRPSHFKGKAAETIDQALANFFEHNDRLAAIMAKDTLSPKDIAAVHELTYTLENALQKMNADFLALADTLETVHLASETTDGVNVKARGLQYLQASPKKLR